MSTHQINFVFDLFSQFYQCFRADASELTEELDGGVRVRVSLPRDLTSSTLFFIFGVMSSIQMTECLD